MRRLWLIFAQTATVCLALLFVVSTLRPDLLAWNPRGSVVTIKEPAAEGVPVPSASFRDAARKAMPAVVTILTSKEIKRPRSRYMDDPVLRFFFGDHPDAEVQRREGLGSGVIVSAEGYVLTNHHVVEAVDQIEVALADRRKAQARIVGTDPETDLAVLKIELANLPAITFGKSDQTRVGDIVLAIGNQFDVGQTVTFGIISAVGRSHLGLNTFENFIQTDASINPGNSGGALVDASGNLIGINTAIYSRSGGSMGIGFAIPESLARQVMEEIIAHGSVTRGWVGIGVQDLTRDLAESFDRPRESGALVSEVVRGSPADRAGIKPGDILTAVEGKPVTDSAGVLQLIAALKPGRQVALKLVRNKAETEVRVTIGKRPKPSRQ